MEKPWREKSAKARKLYLSNLDLLYGSKSLNAGEPIAKKESLPRASQLSQEANIKLPTEAEEQIRLVTWMKKQGLRPIVSANGGSRHYLEAVKLKRTGVTAGIPDIFLPIPSGGYHGLFIELKRQKGGKVSPEQLSWLQYLREQGYMAEIASGCEAAQKVITEYLALTAPAA